MRLRCANSISTFLRSQRDWRYSGVSAIFLGHIPCILVEAPRDVAVWYSGSTAVSMHRLCNQTLLAL